MTTMDLLERALRKHRDISVSEYSRQLHFNRTALNVAMYRGKLSPRMAGAIAEDLGEDVQKWIAIAARESHRWH